MGRVYLDSAATTPLLGEARAAMSAWAEEGNPSSLHWEGRAAKMRVDEAREAFSEAFGCLFGEVVFTSSGTEAANLAVVGSALGALDSGVVRRRILMGAAEHHCVLHTREILGRLGFAVELVPVTREGRVEAEAVEERLGEDVLLVSVMHANNELGTLNPVGEIGGLARSAGALFHVDAVQTFPGGWTVDDLGADLVTVSAHKFRGPKGVGALYVRGGTEVRAWAVGGGQEREMRAGTENVSGLVGARVALEWGRDGGWRAAARAARDAFEGALDWGLFTPSVRESERLGGHCHVRAVGIDAEVFLIRLDRAGVSASSGAACSSGSLEPSHVLLACGYTEREAREGLRFSFGAGVGVEEAVWAAGVVNDVARGILAARI